jgi:hypothetical protein
MQNKFLSQWRKIHAHRNILFSEFSEITEDSKTKKAPLGNLGLFSLQTAGLKNAQGLCGSIAVTI